MPCARVDEKLLPAFHNEFLSDLGVFSSALGIVHTDGTGLDSELSESETLHNLHSGIIMHFTNVKHVHHMFAKIRFWLDTNSLPYLT